MAEEPAQQEVVIATFWVFPPCFIFLYHIFFIFGHFLLVINRQMSTSRRKVAGSAHLVPQTKETLLKMPASGPPSEKRSDHRTPDFSSEKPRSCDICRRSETIWNLIVVCSSCKVIRHFLWIFFSWFILSRDSFYFMHDMVSYHAPITGCCSHGLLQMC